MNHFVRARRWGRGLSLFLGVLLLPLASSMALAASYDEDEEYVDPLERRWKEAESVLPAAPDEKNLLRVEVGGVSTNRYFIDGATLAVGDDSVVRYTLVTVSEGGARNVTFEGMRCETREVKVIAIGRPDGSWYRSPRARWQTVQYKQLNGYHASLLTQYFCAEGTIRNADEGRRLLKQGGVASAIR